MNVEQLRAVLADVKKELDANQSAELLQQLATHLTNQVNQPQQAQHQQQVAGVLQNLYQVLPAAPSNDFGPLRREILDEMKVSPFLGNALKGTLEGIFSRNQITPAVARTEVSELQGKVSAMRSAVDSVLNGLRVLNVGIEELAPGECEVGIRIPRGFVHNDLNDFGEELTELDQILEPFAELTTGTRKGFSIRSIASSELSVFLHSPANVALAIAATVERVVALYKKLLEIRSLHAELKAQDISEERLAGVEEHANELMTKNIEKEADAIVETYYAVNDNGRKYELQTAIKFSMKKIADRIDRGFNFEVQMAPPKIDPNAPEEERKELLAREASIKNAQKELNYVHTDGAPILYLTLDKKAAPKPATRRGTRKTGPRKKAEEPKQ